jgi:hypothetical protein
VSVEYDDTKHEATVTIKGIGEYSGECRYTVKVNTASVTKAPIRIRGIEYDGSPQKLLDSDNPGEAKNGTLVYAIGTKDGPTEEFSSVIPTATNAGAYYIWYKAAGDENHYDSGQQRIVQPAVIAPLQPFVFDEDRIVRVGDTIKLTPAIDPKLAATFFFASSN